MKKGNDSMKGIKRLLIYIVTVVILSSMLTTVSGYEYGDDIENFLYPSIEKTARATYVLNGKINKSDFNDNITKVSETSMWNGYAFYLIFQQSRILEPRSLTLFRNILNVVNIMIPKYQYTLTLQILLMSQTSFLKNMRNTAWSFCFWKNFLYRMVKQ